MTNTVKLMFKRDDSAKNAVNERAQRRIQNDKTPELTPLLRSIHFLRGVHSRAGFALSGFYTAIATDIQGDNACLIEGYPGKVLQSQMHLASMNAVTISCRKVFDDSTKRLSGAMFGKLADAVLKEHAEYWAKSSGRTFDESFKALTFLRTVFSRCSRQEKLLLQDDSTLCRRIGFIKQYANRQAAHISLQDYEFGPLDLAHIVAAIVLIGEIIRGFDAAWIPADHFNQVDEAAFSAIGLLYPDSLDARLFSRMQVEHQARACWKRDEADGMHMLLEQLPYAIGWY